MREIYPAYETSYVLTKDRLIANVQVCITSVVHLPYKASELSRLLDYYSLYITQTVRCHESYNARDQLPAPFNI
jgi:hypothetical protein